MTCSGSVTQGRRCSSPEISCRRCHMRQTLFFTKVDGRWMISREYACLCPMEGST